VASRQTPDQSTRGKGLPWAEEITQSRFSSLLASITDGLVVLNREWRYTYVNSAAERLLGTGRAELLGRVVWEVYPGELGTTRELESRRAVRENTPVVFENYWIPTRRWLETSMYPCDDGFLLAYFRDITERKRAEEERARLAAIVESSDDAIISKSLDSIIQSWNFGAQRIFGYTAEEAVGKPVAILIPPNRADEEPAILRRIRNGERIEHYETIRRRKDGSLVEISLTVSPITDPNGSIIGASKIARDVTERKRANDALSEAHAQLEQRVAELRGSQAQLIDSQRLANVGSWERDVATGRVRWSDQMYRIYGLPDDTRLVFQTFLSLVHPKDLSIISEAQRSAVAADAPIVVEYRITRPDGKVRFIRSIAEGVKNEHDALVRFVGTDQDITEQVKATELLRESEARLKSAERMTHVGNWIWEIKANRVSLSEEMSRILGQPRNYEPSYEASLQMIVPEDRNRTEQWVRDCLAEKKDKLIEARIVQPTGEVRTVVCTAEVLLDEDGLPERMFGTCQDVTDARRAQEDAFARQKLESLGTLASGIAHDFNNLLGTILAQAELATAELATGSHADEELKQIREGSIRGSEIVRELMTYSGGDKADLEPVDVARLAKEMLELLNVSVSKHAVLKSDFPEDLPPVRGNAPQLRQLVMNLVINASEAIGETDGVIRVTLSRIAPGQDLPSNDPANWRQSDHLRLEVSDTGSGMTEETQDRIFDPFYTTKFAGRGLGLAVVRSIVSNHGGAINVVSAPGEGTTFQIDLPCTGEPSNSDGAAAVATSGGRISDTTGTVLLVEDEDMLRLAISKMLRRHGFSVIEAANGSAALDLVRSYRNSIDVILLDLTIPGAPSSEVVAEAQRMRAGVTVVLMSAYSRGMVPPSLNVPHVKGFIRKPFQMSDLLQLLRDSISAEHK
jgi:two-component system cell cycle sensor histidine kinase/response regulator CckA